MYGERNAGDAFIMSEEVTKNRTGGKGVSSVYCAACTNATCKPVEIASVYIS